MPEPDDLSAPSMNRWIGAGVVRAARVYTFEDERRVFRFTLGTRRLMRIGTGKTILGYDWHFCTINGDKQVDKAVEEIKRGAWVLVEAHLAYKDLHTNSPDYRRITNIAVEYWQMVKRGDPSFKPDIREGVTGPNDAGLGDRSRAWDEISEHKDALNETRETRGGA